MSLMDTLPDAWKANIKREDIAAIVPAEKAGWVAQWSRSFDGPAYHNGAQFSRPVPDAASLSTVVHVWSTGRDWRRRTYVDGRPAEPVQAFPTVWEALNLPRPNHGDSQ